MEALLSVERLSSLEAMSPRCSCWWIDDDRLIGGGVREGEESTRWRQRWEGAALPLYIKHTSEPES